MSAVGNIGLDSIAYEIGPQHAYQQVLVVSVDDTIIITDLDGQVLAERTRPAPGVKYFGNGRPRGGPGSNTTTDTEVLTHQPSPMS